MKFKALLLVILTLATNALAMEPTEPIAPSNEQSAAQVAKKEETIKKAGIAADDNCMVCQDTAKGIPADQLNLTECCDNFICHSCQEAIRKTAQDNAALYSSEEGIGQSYAENGYILRNQLKALCPFCRADLVTKKSKLASTQKPIEIIDFEGTKFTLDPELSEALLKCTALEAHKLHGGVLDFSGNNRPIPFITKDYMFDWHN